MVIWDDQCWRLQFSSVCGRRGSHVWVKCKVLLQYTQIGNYSHFMLKEIFEQPESVVNTMRGRMQFDQYKGEPSIPSM